MLRNSHGRLSKNVSGTRCFQTRSGLVAYCLYNVKKGTSNLGSDEITHSISGQTSINTEPLERVLKIIVTVVMAIMS